MRAVVFVFVVMAMFVFQAKLSTPLVSTAARQSCGVVKPEMPCGSALDHGSSRVRYAQGSAFCLARVPRKPPEGNKLGRNTMREVIRRRRYAHIR